MSAVRSLVRHQTGNGLILRSPTMTFAGAFSLLSTATECKESLITSRDERRVLLISRNMLENSKPAQASQKCSMRDSEDVRKRVVAAVVTGGLSCNEAAKQFGVAVSTTIGWVRRHRETSSVAPGKIGGHRPKVISGETPHMGFRENQARLHLARLGRRAR
jgi:hypothetical protein